MLLRDVVVEFVQVLVFFGVELVLEVGDGSLHGELVHILDELVEFRVEQADF